MLTLLLIDFSLIGSRNSRNPYLLSLIADNSLDGDLVNIVVCYLIKSSYMNFFSFSYSCIFFEINCFVIITFC